MSAFSQSVGHARLAPIIISIRAVRVNIIPATTLAAAEKQKENRVVAFAFGPGTAAAAAADVHSDGKALAQNAKMRSISIWMSLNCCRRGARTALAVVVARRPRRRNSKSTFINWRAPPLLS